MLDSVWTADKVNTRADRFVDAPAIFASLFLCRKDVDARDRPERDEGAIVPRYAAPTSNTSPS